ncbi:MAG: phosphate-starvation-inducible PsiE family protein [Candidatus Woesearchaeota archaeon]|jgi:uncharacterized membrane protein (DUF373 family)|nr:phosphate-starvation-inducible PsiE family protein [Candidatus Woesearchaeota archaeon]|tara:strand:+ start:176 stop:643 length:468 start_codon:yes stop_codon:yes gene_type:complete
MEDKKLVCKEDKEGKLHCTEQKVHKFIDDKLLGMLDVVLHILLFILIVALLVAILFELKTLFFVHLFNASVNVIIDHILFAFILVELFTILYSYLKKHYIKVERVVEVGIISLVRDLIFRIPDIETGKIYAIAVTLLVLGAIFFVEKHFSKDRNN